MDLRAALAAEHSIAVTKKIAAYVGSDATRFAELMEVFLHGEYRLSQRAAWAVGHCAGAQPHLILPYIRPMLEKLRTPKLHDAIKRNTFRVLQYIDMPSDCVELAVNACYDFFSDKSEAIAIRVFAMTVWAKLCRQLPDLKEELCLLIEDELPYAAPAFVSRGKKILKQLRKK